MLSTVPRIVTHTACAQNSYRAFIPFTFPALCTSSSKIPERLSSLHHPFSPVNVTCFWLLPLDTSPSNWPTTPALLLNLWKVSSRELVFATLSFLTVQPTLHEYHTSEGDPAEEVAYHSWSFYGGTGTQPTPGGTKRSEHSLGLSVEGQTFINNCLHWVLEKSLIEQLATSIRGKRPGGTGMEIQHADRTTSDG